MQLQGFFFSFPHTRHSNVLVASSRSTNYMPSASWRAFDGLKMWPLSFRSVSRQSFPPVTPIWAEFTLALARGGSNCRQLPLKWRTGEETGPPYWLPLWRGRVFLFFFPQDFWRDPKSAADGGRMGLRGNLGRAWKASQEVAALKCWAGPHWIKGRRPPPYALHRYA